MVRVWVSLHAGLPFTHPTMFFFPPTTQENRKAFRRGGRIWDLIPIGSRQVRRGPPFAFLYFSCRFGKGGVGERRESLCPCSASFLLPNNLVRRRCDLLAVLPWLARFFSSRRHDPLFPLLFDE